MFEEAVGSLFGVRQVAYYDVRTDQAMMRGCLFATPGVFERHPELVASVISHGPGFGFCVNEFAPDFAAFQGSALYHSFARIHPPASATDLRENRGFLAIGDLSVDRRSDNAIASYLGRAYGLEKPVVLRMKSHATSMVVERAAPRDRRSND